jgi:hypothetical protein
MTRSAAISIAILALVALALIMLLGRSGGHAASMPTGDEPAAMIDPRADQGHGVFDEVTGKRVGMAPLKIGPNIEPAGLITPPTEFETPFTRWIGLRSIFGWQISVSSRHKRHPLLGTSDAWLIRRRTSQRPSWRRRVEVAGFEPRSRRVAPPNARLGELPWAENRGYSPAPIAVASVPRSC